MPSAIGDIHGINNPYAWSRGANTYTEYNYTKAGWLAAYIKTRHFETALYLTREYFYKCNVIDFGCADGPFLPSLARYFDHVVGIDLDRSQIELARRLCAKWQLSNVDLICSADRSIDDISRQLGQRKFTLLFLLETLEHIGDKQDPYRSKIELLKKLRSLLEDQGLIIMSVPVMVGLPFLLQRIGLWMLRKYREPISMANLLKAVFLKNTRGLESKWAPGLQHLGFNHLYLEKMLKKEFKVTEKSCFFRKFYILS